MSYLSPLHLKRQTTLLGILFISFALKMVVWGAVVQADASRFLSPDSASYIDAALTLLLPRNAALASHRTPGFPLMIAAIFYIFGDSQPIVIIILILLSLVTITLTYKIADKLFNGTAALLAALLLGFDIASFSYSLKFLTETLFALLVSVLLVAGVCFFQTNGRKRWGLLIGMAITAATLVRPISYYLIVPIALGILPWSLTQQWPWTKILGRLVLVVLPFIMFVGGWQVRNHLVLGSAQISSIGSTNMFYYRAASVVALKESISLQQAREQLHQTVLDYRNAHPETANWTDEQLADHMMKEGVGIILKHPILFLRTQVSGTIPMLLGGGEGPLLRLLNIPVGQTLDVEIFDALTNFDLGFFFRRFASGTALAVFLYAMAYLGIIYVGMLLWLVRALVRRQMTISHLFVWGVVLYFVLISAGPEAGSRFRVPIMPVLTIYAGLGYTQLAMAVKVNYYGE